MVRYLAIGFFGVSLGLVVAPKNFASTDCDILVSPREMLECYSQEFKNANEELHNLLQRLNQLLNAQEQEGERSSSCLGHVSRLSLSKYVTPLQSGFDYSSGTGSLFSAVNQATRKGVK